jgi:hypothetical protein
VCSEQAQLAARHVIDISAVAGPRLVADLDPVRVARPAEQWSAPVAPMPTTARLDAG